MRAIVAWLVAKPQNAILGLAGALFVQIVGGAVMALLVLYQGPMRSAVTAVAAMALLVVIALIIGTRPDIVMAYGVVAWLPVMLFASLLRHWRSVTLTLQVSVIVALLILSATYAVVADPVEFGKAVLHDLAPIVAQMGSQAQADILLAQQDLIAPKVIVLAVFVSWSIVVGALILGYALMQMLPGQSRVYGQFRDLNFGRLLAGTMIVALVVAMVSGIAWLQYAAFLIFAAFWLQGFAIAHWLYAEKRLPFVLLVLLYLMLPILHMLAIVAFAAVGYLDVWFGFRRRVVTEV